MGGLFQRKNANTSTQPGPKVIKAINVGIPGVDELLVPRSSSDLTTRLVGASCSCVLHPTGTNLNSPIKSIVARRESVTWLGR